jgi:hypothetical protein
MIMPAFVQAHYFALTIGGYIVLTMARQLPKPGVPFNAYEYFYKVINSLLAEPIVKAFEDKVVTTTTTSSTKS